MFKRKQKPQKLTLRQIHELYLLLLHALPKEEKKFLIDEVEYILDNCKPGTLARAVGMMYGNTPNNMNGIEATALFAKGLMNSNFFSYVDFIGYVNGRRNS